MRDYLPLAVAVCALIAGVYGARASTRATRVNQEANQIKWIQEARQDSIAAKKDAAEATDAAADIKRELAQNKRETIELRDLTEELTRWILRVVNWAHDETMDGPELKRLINGGPPSLRSNGSRQAPPPSREIP
jgi:hypothetical protein